MQTRKQVDDIIARMEERHARTKEEKPVEKPKDWLDEIDARLVSTRYTKEVPVTRDEVRKLVDEVRRLRRVVDVPKQCLHVNTTNGLSHNDPVTVCSDCGAVL